MTEFSYLDAARDVSEEMIEASLGLVEQESPSGDNLALESSAAYVAELGQRLLGQPPEIVRTENVPHLLWKIGSGDRRALLLGHHDTVWPIGSLAELPALVVDGIMRGPGCFDMKVGIVQGLFACSLIIEHEGLDALDGVTILITGDEETGSQTSRSLIESEAAQVEAVLVLEAAAPGGALKIARKGVSLYEIEVRGRAAHAGLEPELGINAGLEMATQIQRIAGLGDLNAGTSVVPTSGTIGTTSNTVPASALLTVDVRAETSVEQNRVDSRIRGLTTLNPEASVHVSGGPNRPPMESDMSSVLFDHARRAARVLGLPELEGVAVGGASDGNFTSALGIPTLDGLGAVGGGAHSADEHVVVASIPEQTARLAQLLSGLMSTRSIPY
ncbi:M20 family metallopeptidase [Paenarthrobacter sp. NPDC056912]|uniref:M20 family metallopeptidase n=1 Tax=Paenarthrobacter sp. NPDC056912 TaxID=3345965 RepID=UPI00366B2F6D